MWKYTSQQRGASAGRLEISSKKWKLDDGPAIITKVMKDEKQKQKAPSLIIQKIFV